MLRMAHVIVLLLVLAAPARAAIDYARMSQPDVMELLQLGQKEEWEALIAKGEAAAKKAEAAHDTSGIFFINQQLWLAYFNLGLGDEAMAANARSKRAYYELTRDDPAQAGLATLQYANALATGGEPQKAIALVDETLKTTPKDFQYRDMLVWQKAVALYMMDRTKQAAAALDDDAKALGGGFAAANEWLLASEMLAAETEDAAEAQRLGKAALAAFTPLAANGTVMVGGRGDASLLPRAMAAAGQHATAIPLYEKYCGDFVVRPGVAQSQRNVYQMNAVLGFWEDRAGHADKAITHYTAAIDALDRTWSRLKVQENKESLMASGHPFYVPKPTVVYERLILLLLSSKREADALRLAERFKARAFVDLLGRRAEKIPGKAPAGILQEERRLFKELAKTQKPGAQAAAATALAAQYGAILDHIREADPELADIILPRTVTVADIQKLLDPDTVLLKYFVGAEKTVAWVIGPRKIDFVVLPVGRAKLARSVDTCLKVMSRPGPAAPLKRDLKTLSDMVLAPVLPALGSARRVVVAPHGLLHYVPFAALLDAKGDYLIATREVAQVPSASVLAFCARKNPRRGRAFDVGKAKTVAFALGNTQPAAKEWQPLPGTADEVKRIQKVLPNTKVIAGPQMKRAAVEQNVAAADLVHFATHGHFNDEKPLASCLVFSDALMPVSEVFGLKMKAYSVALSACQTGLGRVMAGDDVVGLTRAFIYAGTPAVISTMWKIADESTARLMAGFYTSLAKMDRAAALRKAQLEMLADPTTAHPFFWAAFVVAGDWK
ncbi:MAG: CHAT domain-containing protein [Armatimonadetes bacterium]|nr:CHAT domain-containing protein [Armatimonadota bacterium]